MNRNHLTLKQDIIIIIIIIIIVIIIIIIIVIIIFMKVANLNRIICNRFNVQCTIS
jgi:hypothetical protein